MLTSCPICESTDISDYFTLKSIQLIALKCKYCRHVFIRNSPICSENIAHYYTMSDFMGNRQLQNKEWYTNYYSECFADYERYLDSSETLKQFQQKLIYLDSLYPQRGRLLDIGCATGVFLDMAKKRGWYVEGTEISNELASYASDKFSLKVNVIDLTKEKFNPGIQYDVVTLFDVIEHIPYPNLIIKACRDLLRHGGTLLLRTPTEEGLFRDIAKTIYFFSFKKMELPMLWFYSFEHIQSFSLTTLKYLLKKHNFEIIKIFREEENLQRINVPAFIKLMMRVVSAFSFLLRKQHKITVLARKI